MKPVKSLTADELGALLDVAGKHSDIDRLMLQVTFNHGLRASETLALTRANVTGGYLDVQRLKKSRRTRQPLLPTEAEGLKSLIVLRGDEVLFPMERTTFWRRMKTYGAEAGIPSFKCHPHVLKHTCGKLGRKGGMEVEELQTYLGHVNGANTMIYMQADEEEAAAAFASALGVK